MTLITNLWCKEFAITFGDRKISRNSGDSAEDTVKLYSGNSFTLGYTGKFWLTQDTYITDEIQKFCKNTETTNPDLLAVEILRHFHRINPKLHGYFILNVSENEVIHSYLIDLLYARIIFDSLLKEDPSIISRTRYFHYNLRMNHLDYEKKIIDIDHKKEWYRDLSALVKIKVEELDPILLKYSINTFDWAKNEIHTIKDVFIKLYQNIVKTDIYLDIGGAKGDYLLLYKNGKIEKGEFVLEGA